MNPFIRAGAIALATMTGTISVSGLSAKTFVDPRLEAWRSTKDAPGAIPETRRVIVFLNVDSFTNRSGASRLSALVDERASARTQIQMDAAEILAGLGSRGNFISQQKPETLWASNAFMISLDRKSISKVANHPRVEGIIEDYSIQYEAPLTADQTQSRVTTDETIMTYGLQKINVEAAWDRGITGKDVLVGIIDTGIDRNHPELKDKVVAYKDFTDDNDTVDYHGHGTHVAGTIAGSRAFDLERAATTQPTTLPSEMPKAIGVAPEAKLVVAKVFNKSGQSSLASLLKAMEWVLDPDGDPNTDDAPRVVSNSWGAPHQFSYGFRNVVRNWRRFEVFPSFAAGNSSWYLMIAAPGSYPFSFAIGATDENHDRAFFSSRGPTIWWKNWYPVFFTKPDIAAPGLDVYSAFPGGIYKVWSGTSMAAPHVTGVIALALQAKPFLKVADLEQILQTSALDRGREGKDNRFGSGVIQVDRVLETLNRWQNTSLSSFQDKDPRQWEWVTP